LSFVVYFGAEFRYRQISSRIVMTDVVI